MFSRNDGRDLIDIHALCDDEIIFPFEEIKAVDSKHLYEGGQDVLKGDRLFRDDRDIELQLAFVQSEILIGDLTDKSNVFHNGNIVEIDHVALLRRHEIAFT